MKVLLRKMSTRGGAHGEGVGYGNLDPNKFFSCGKDNFKQALREVFLIRIISPYYQNTFLDFRRKF